MPRWRVAFGQGQLRQALPISKGRIAPPCRFDALPVERRRDGGVARRVDERPEQVPLPLRCIDTCNAPIIVSDEFVPEASAGWHPVGPRHVVEPQEIGVAHAFQVGKASPHVRRILRNGIASGRSSIESDAARIGVAVIAGISTRLGEIANPGTGAVVMIGRHLMGETKRSHIVHCRLARARHYLNDRPNQARVVSPGHACPFFSDA